MATAPSSSSGSKLSREEKLLEEGEEVEQEDRTTTLLPPMVEQDNRILKFEKENKCISALKEEIVKLKNTVSECTCSKYSKSMDEVIRHGQKHKDAVIELKKISETQKEKISILREEKTSFLNRVDMLEFEIETDQVIVSKHKDKIESLEIK